MTDQLRPEKPEPAGSLFSDIYDLVRFLRVRAPRVANQLSTLLARMELLENVVEAARVVEDTLPLHHYENDAPATLLKAALYDLDLEPQ